ncbi:ATP-binding protein [Actinoplanes sp. ATCC 53533]|uniref:ATP-binding protein n=1 Tax=Actinoplanes sp. ATCC 53533 TaxID=1288362 RepID=UPI000F76F0F5|nr:ATP-binding protein [Actinoplanes sp. ATCC 53533]RSM64250.1 ATP-binding protein [Actinoplanes sp. ATCC 53533]
MIELTARGRWDRLLHTEVTDTLRKCFAQHPAALILNVHDLDDGGAASATVWMSARMIGADLDPPVQVVVCVPTDTPLAARLQRLGARRMLPLFASMPEARSAAASRLPLTDRLVARLAPTNQAPGIARGLVSAACAAWSLPSLLYPAKLVVSELVLNAVEHAGTDIEVTISRRGTGIHIAVADLDPRLPDMPARPRSATDQHHTGLSAVRSVATIAGTMSTPAGKVVWAVLRPSPGETVIGAGRPPA